MKSKVFVTQRIDAPQEAAKELSELVREGMTLEKNSIGILQCYSDMDVEAFLEALGDLPFEVIGCTSVASMDGEAGFHELAAMLTVLTSDDCAFAAGVSEPVVPGNVDACVKNTLADVAARLQGEPKLAYAIPPYNLGIMLDEFPAAFNRHAKGLPVLGGLPSNNTEEDANATIIHGALYTDRMVMLLISGDLHPVFSVQNVTGSAVERKRKVTLAKDNTVYRVGKQTFTEYLADIGLMVKQTDGSYDSISFVANPLLLENVKGEGDDTYAFVRTLHKIDMEEGSGTAIGLIPMDATLSICSLERGDIETAATAGIRELSAKMRANEGAAYSTVMAVSCIGRYLLMKPMSDTEAVKIRADLPEGLTFSGFYGYGEIGPVASGAEKATNFAHNESLVLCAF